MENNEMIIVKIPYDLAQYNQNLGFSIKGGYENHQGIFVSRVEKDSISYAQGLRNGDQIMEVNGIKFSSITTDDALECLTEETDLFMIIGRPTKSANLTIMNEKDLPSSDNTLDSYQFQNQQKIHINNTKNKNLGFCIRGGLDYQTGIFVSKVDAGGIAESRGVRPGQQIIDVNGHSYLNILHNEAVHILKQYQSLIMTVVNSRIIPYNPETDSQYRNQDSYNKSFNDHTVTNTNGFNNKYQNSASTNCNHYANNTLSTFGRNQYQSQSKNNNHHIENNTIQKHQYPRINKYNTQPTDNSSDSDTNFPIPPPPAEMLETSTNIKPVNNNNNIKAYSFDLSPHYRSIFTEYDTHGVSPSQTNDNNNNNSIGLNDSTSNNFNSASLKNKFFKTKKHYDFLPVFSSPSPTVTESLPHHSRRHNDSHNLIQHLSEPTPKKKSWRDSFSRKKSSKITYNYDSSVTNTGSVSDLSSLPTPIYDYGNIDEPSHIASYSRRRANSITLNDPDRWSLASSMTSEASEAIIEILMKKLMKKKDRRSLREKINNYLLREHSRVEELSLHCVGLLRKPEYVIIVKETRNLIREEDKPIFDQIVQPSEQAAQQVLSNNNSSNQDTKKKNNKDKKAPVPLSPSKKKKQAPPIPDKRSSSLNSVSGRNKRDQKNGFDMHGSHNFDLGMHSFTQYLDHHDDDLNSSLNSNRKTHSSHQLHSYNNSTTNSSSTTKKKSVRILDNSAPLSSSSSSWIKPSLSSTFSSKQRKFRPTIDTSAYFR